MNAQHHIMQRKSRSRFARQHRAFASARATRGFTITELLVVIGIIILLAGILLVALGRVRTTALSTTTVGTMQAFSQACDAFQIEHQQYPGVIPDSVLAKAIAEAAIDVTASGPAQGTDPSFTSTENALLHLLGGYRVVSPSEGVGSAAEQRYDDFVAAAGAANAPLYEFQFFPGEPNEWKLAVNLRQIGEGPVIDGQQFGPYFTPGPNVIGNAGGQAAVGDQPGFGDNDEPDVVRLPDLLDAWGQPILYFRRMRDSGPLTAPADDATTRPQFYLEVASGYLNSQRLGDNGESQVYSAVRPSGSILSASITEGDRHHNFAQLLRHPSFGEWGPGTRPLEGTNLRQARARGAYALFSAGPDGIFFSATDGPGTSGDPVTNLIAPDYNNPQSIEEYDDIRIFGGG